MPSLTIFIASSKLVAKSLKVPVPLEKATLESYPKVKTLAPGNSFGKKSRSQSLPLPCVYVLNAVNRNDISIEPASGIINWPGV